MCDKSRRNPQAVLPERGRNWGSEQEIRIVLFPEENEWRRAGRAFGRLAFLRCSRFPARSLMRGEEERKRREERREGERPSLSTDRLSFNPLAEARHVTCRCGVAADQHCPSRLG